MCIYIFQRIFFFFPQDQAYARKKFSLLQSLEFGQGVEDAEWQCLQIVEWESPANIPNTEGEKSNSSRLEH